MSTLKHYGVLGMHWGVRKDGGPQGYNGTYSRGSTTTKKRISEPTRTYTKKELKQDLKRMKRGELTEREVNRRLDYMRNSKDYHKQLKKYRKARSTKEPAVKRFLKKYGLALGIVGGTVVATAIAPEKTKKVLDFLTDVATAAAYGAERSRL